MTDQSITHELDNAVADSLQQALSEAFLKWLDKNQHVTELYPGALGGACIFMAQILTWLPARDGHDKSLVDMACETIRGITQHLQTASRSL